MAKRKSSTFERLTSGKINRKQRKELMRRIYADDPGLEIVHRHLALLWFSEVGRDMSRWKAAPCLVSWLAISGSRVFWRGARKAHNRDGHLFRMAACSLDRSATPLGDYMCRIN